MRAVRHRTQWARWCACRSRRTQRTLAGWQRQMLRLHDRCIRQEMAARTLGDDVTAQRMGSLVHRLWAEAWARHLVDVDERGRVRGVRT